jgi:hypothetical protein
VQDANVQTPSHGRIRLFQVISAGLSAAITVIGLIVLVFGGGLKVDLLSLLLIAFALVPTYVFYVGVRRPVSVIVCGTILMGVTLPSWGLYLYSVMTEIGEGLGGVYGFPAIVISFLSSVTGWIRDLWSRELPRQ